MWFSHDGADWPVLKLTGAKLFLNGRGECGGECGDGEGLQNDMPGQCIYLSRNNGGKKWLFVFSLLLDD